jgi:hypothetical protein
MAHNDDETVGSLDDETVVSQLELRPSLDDERMVRNQIAQFSEQRDFRIAASNDPKKCHLSRFWIFAGAALVSMICLIVLLFVLVSSL